MRVDPQRQSALCLQTPGSAHRLIDVGIGARIVDETLFFGIEPEGTSSFHGDLGEIDQGAGAVPVDFVERKLFPRFDRFDEVRQLRGGIGQITNLVDQVGNAGFQFLGKISLGTGEERRGVLVLAVQNDFASIGVPY